MRAWNSTRWKPCKKEAARSLADMARDAIRRSPNGAEHRMSIDVRDDAGPVRFTFEVDRHRL
jgi:hypothetical protein